MKQIIYSVVITFIGFSLSAQEISDPIQYPELLPENCVTNPTIVDLLPEIIYTTPPPTIDVTDTDGDGILDIIEGTEDHDNDGTPNHEDLDSDGDGVPDSEDECYLTFGSPPSGCKENDSDTRSSHFRKVWWVHGYQGNEFSLIRPGNDVGGVDINAVPVEPTGRFEVRSYFPTYNSSQSSLSSAAQNLKTDIIDVAENEINTENNFIIAHSMGGLVSRTMGEIENPDGEPLYNGLITFGTPHQGAMIADNFLTTTLIPDALENLCVDLSIGPICEELYSVPVVGPLGATLGFGGLAANTGCSLGVDFGFPVFASFNTVGVETQLTTTAAGGIADMPTDHKAVFYGTEDDDNGTMTARFLGSIIAPPNSGAFGLYGADASDGIGITAVASALNFYDTKYETWKEDNTPWYAWIIPIIGLIDELGINSTADAYKRGRDWFPSMNPTWKEIIGAGQVELVENGCDCYFENWATGQLEWQGYFPNCNPSFTCDALTPHFDLQFVTNDVSDGFILGGSAMNGPGMNYEARFMEGSNHLQMKNDSGMEDAVKKIFEDGLDAGNQNAYFRTEKR